MATVMLVALCLTFLTSLGGMTILIAGSFSEPPGREPLAVRSARRRGPVEPDGPPPADPPLPL